MNKRKNMFRWVLLIAALVLINYLASLFHSRADLTEEKRYSLTSTTRQLLRQLEGDISIDLFLAGDMPAEFKKLSRSSQEFVATLREQNPGRIRYRLLDPMDEMEAGRRWADTLQSLGASPINLTVQVKAGEERKNIFPYALVRYGEETELVNLFPTSRRNVTVAELNNAEATMEYQFARAIDRMQHPAKPLVAYAIGHGEPTGIETYSLQHAIDPEHTAPFQSDYFSQTQKSNYQLVLFNLKTQPSIPDTFRVLLIVKPDTSFTDAEKLKIDQYVMRGGRVLWFIDNLFAEPDSLSIKSKLVAYERNLNIQDLLFNYGVRINPDLIMDLQSDFLPFAVGGTATEPQYEFLKWNYYPLFGSDNKNSITRNLGLVAGKFVNSIDTIETEQIRKTILLHSSENSRTISTPALISPNENRNTPEDALFRQQHIPAAVLLEGPFNSFFRGRISRSQVDSLVQYGGYREQATDGKMIVVADGDMVLNEANSDGPLPMGRNLFTTGSQYEYPAANTEFLLNSLEYLTSASTISETRNKEIVLRLLDMKKVAEEKTKWQLINIVLPILIIILLGFIYQQVRKRQYASVSR